MTTPDAIAPQDAPQTAQQPGRSIPSTPPSSTSAPHTDAPALAGSEADAAGSGDRQTSPEATARHRQPSPREPLAGVSGEGSDTERQPLRRADGTVTSAGAAALGRIARGDLVDGGGVATKRRLKAMRARLVHSTTPGELEEVRQAVLEKARKGDLGAARLLLDYVVESPKAARADEGRPLPIALPIAVPIPYPAPPPDPHFRGPLLPAPPGAAG